MTERGGARAHLDRLGARVRALLAPEGPALDLAVLRVTVACVLSLSTSVAAAHEWAALPEPARTVPLGVGWLVPLLPIDPGTVTWVRVAFRVACVLGGLGLFTRASWIAITACTFYLLLVPQLGGAVFHDHHLLWLAAILAASPAGDALSADAWLAERRGRSLPSRGRAHGLAVRLSWLVIGLVFFFPGVHKLAESGLAWALSDNLRNQMWWKWAQDPALVPALRIDRSAGVCRALAAATILFELSFLPLVLHPRTRPLAVLSALAFHAGTHAFMGIDFSVLWATYPMFVPWQAVLDRVRRRPAPALLSVPAPDRSTTPQLATALPLFAGIVLAGATGSMQAYPFACYPTFQWMADDTMPALAIEIEHGDGRREPLDRALFQDPGPRGWALSWRLAGVYGPFDRAAFEAWWRDRAARPPLHDHVQDAVHVRAARVRVSIDPDRPAEVVAATALLEL